MEQALGTRHVLVNREAREPADILLPTGIHDSLVRELTKAVYKRSQCYHIRALVSPEAARVSLQDLREKILQNQDTDTHLIGFMDELFFLFEDLFSREENQPASNKKISSSLLFFDSQHLRQG